MDITRNGSSTARSTHGSIERIPGAMFRAMVVLFARKHPHTAREALARALTHRLSRVELIYHVRTLKRQLSGAIASVPPEVEAAMQELLIESNGLRTPRDIERALAASGLRVDRSKRLPQYVTFERVRPLIELWLYLNPGRSMRSLACRLQQDLRRRGVRLAVTSLQAILAEQQPLVRLALREQLLGYLAECGVPSEAQAKARWQRKAESIRVALERRRFVQPDRFSRLCRLWQLHHHEASSRRLALLLQQRMSKRGVSLGLHHYQELINGKTRRVRHGILEAVEELVIQDFPRPEDLEAALAKASADSPEAADLCWVRVRPIAALARQWLARHPECSQRRLAIRLAQTVRRMGYSCSYHTVQSILARGKQKTRGYVYRAMLKQFKARSRARVPEEDLIRPARLAAEEPRLETVRNGHAGLQARRHALSGRGSRQQALEGYITQARAYLSSAHSPRLLEFLAVRAEHLYGVPRDKVKACLRTQKRGRRFRPETFPLQTDQQELWHDVGAAVDALSVEADSDYTRIAERVHSDEPVGTM